VQCLAGFGNLRQQGRRRLEIPVGIGDVPVAEVRAEGDDVAGNRGPLMAALFQ
jgi:hypothetical protein